MNRLGAAGLAVGALLGLPATALADETGPRPAVTLPPAAPPTATPAPIVAAPASAVAPAVTTHSTTSPGHAVVHLAVDYRDAWLETRQYVDDDEFARTCRAPCDITLNVQGLEARVVAPGMTPSNTFRFDAGIGAAGVRVDGGSAAARAAGIIALAAGIPVALGGMALFAHGNVKDKSGFKAAGVAALALGGVSIGVSFPLLLVGTTRVKNARGARIASLFTLPAH